MSGEVSNELVNAVSNGRSNGMSNWMCKWNEICFQTAMFTARRSSGRCCKPSFIHCHGNLKEALLLPNYLVPETSSHLISCFGACPQHSNAIPYARYVTECSEPQKMACRNAILARSMEYGGRRHNSSLAYCMPSCIIQVTTDTLRGAQGYHGQQVAVCG